MKTTRTIVTQNGSKVIVTVERKVADKVAYMDGSALSVGREVIERKEIAIHSASGQVDKSDYINYGNETFPLNEKMVSQGAVAKIGNAHLTQDTLDQILTALAECEAENPKTQEQIEIEAAQSAAIAQAEAWLESDDYRRMVEINQAMDDPNSDL